MDEYDEILKKMANHFEEKPDEFVKYFEKGLSNLPSTEIEKHFFFLGFFWRAKNSGQ